MLQSLVSNPYRYSTNFADYILFVQLYHVSNPYRYSTNNEALRETTEQQQVSNPYRYSTNSVPRRNVVSVFSFKPLQVFYKLRQFDRSIQLFSSFKPLQVFYKQTAPFFIRSLTPRFQTLIGILQTQKLLPSIFCSFYVSNPYRYSTNLHRNSGLARLMCSFKPLQVFYKQHCFWLYLSF